MSVLGPNQVRASYEVDAPTFEALGVKVDRLLADLDVIGELIEDIEVFVGIEVVRSQAGQIVQVKYTPTATVKVAKGTYKLEPRK